MRNLLLLLIILGSASVLAGALMKIQHYAGANVLLGAGVLLEIICAFLFMLRSWRQR